MSDTSALQIPQKFGNQERFSPTSNSGNMCPEQTIESWHLKAYMKII